MQILVRILIVIVVFCRCSYLQMSQKIEELEKAALGEKPWQLSGEVTAQARPENSMLEEDVEFDQTSRMGEWLQCEMSVFWLKWQEYLSVFYFSKKRQ